MSEVTARLALYGAIDRIIVESGDDAMRQRAAIVFPEYGDPETPGWYESMREIVGPHKLPVLDLDVALDELSSIEIMSDAPGAAVVAAHRLLVLWAAHAILQPVGETARRLVAALEPIRTLEPPPVGGLARGGMLSTGLAGGFLVAPSAPASDQFGIWGDPFDRSGSDTDDGGGGGDTESPRGGPGSFPISGPVGFRDLLESLDVLEFDAFVESVERADLASSVVAGCANVLSDTRSDVWAIKRGGQTIHAAAITSDVRVQGYRRSLRDLKLLKPSNWPTCLPSFWCGMDGSVDNDPHDGVDYYIERVGECPTEWFDPCLAFKLAFKNDPKSPQAEAMLTYRLWDPTGPAGPVVAGTPQDDRLTIDEGTIKVARDGEAIDVYFSKAIAFREPLPTPAVALFVKGSGWADQTASLVAGCLQ